MVPRMFEVHFLTKSLRNALFFKKLKNRSLEVPDEKSDIRDRKPIPWGTFWRYIDFLKKLNWKVQILDFGFWCYFWLPSEAAKYDFFAIKKYFIKMFQIQKVIYETLVNSILLNKVSLWYVWIWDPEHRKLDFKPPPPRILTRVLWSFKLNASKK